MKLLKMTGILFVLTLMVSATAVAGVIYSEDFTAATNGDSLNTVSWNSAGWAPQAWDYVGYYYPGGYALNPGRFDIYAGLHPGWNPGPQGEFAGGYYSGYQMFGTIGDWYKTFGSQTSGKYSMTVKVSPETKGRVGDNAIPDRSYIGLGNSSGGFMGMGVAYWYFDNDPSPGSGLVRWIFKGTGGSSAAVITPVNESTLLSINVDLDALTASGTIQIGSTTYNSGSVALTAGTIFDSVVTEQYKYGRYGFDFTDINVTQTGSPGSISGGISFENYTGDVTLAPVKIELIQGVVVLRTEEARATSPNQNPLSYTIANVPAGTYDVAFTACKWLKKVVTGVDVPDGGVAPVSPTLVNGDLDGDGGVTTTDLSVLLSSL